MDRRADHGFTLIEILVVLAILGVAMGLIIGRGPMRSRGLEARAAAGSLAQSFRAARARAIAIDADVQVVIDPARHVFAADGSKPVVVSRELSMAVEPAAPGQAVLKGPGSTRIIRFSPDGSSSGGEVLLGLGRRRIGITVEWLTGQVKVADAPA